MAPLAAGIAAFLFRFLTTGALENDHFVHLARAHQVVHGAWPIRDFVDPGMPLQYLASAAAAAVLGPSLLSDVLLHILLLAIAAAVTLKLTHRATESLPLAAMLTALQVLAMPRLYSAPKLFVHVIVIALGWRYADRPSIGRLSALAAWTAVAFLFRHDHAVYAGIALVVLIALCRRPLGVRAVVSHVLLYVAMVVACVLPWVAYVSWAIGLREYISSAVVFAEAESARTYTVVMPVAIGVSLLSIAAVWLVRLRRSSRVSVEQVTFASVLLLLLANAFVRDALAARWADIAGPAVIVLACCSRPAESRSLRLSAQLGVVVILILLAGILFAARRRQVTPDMAWRRASIVTERLTRWPWRGAVPSEELVPLASYVNRCTEPDDHVLAGWFAPEFAVIARRPFAAGHESWTPGYYGTQSDQMQALASLSRESVPIVLLNADFAASWPLLHRHLTEPPYVREMTLEVQGRPIEMWIDGRRRTGRRDAETSLPCFTGRP